MKLLIYLVDMRSCREMANYQVHINHSVRCITLPGGTQEWSVSVI